MERMNRIEDDGTGVADALRAELKQKVIGQDHAADVIGDALDKARFRDERRPVASFLFIGSTGVGKTQMAESLAQTLRPDDPKLLRIDCGQFTQRHEKANLIGAPVGYVGREQPPLLDPEIIETPGSVLLFDEIEKADPAIQDTILQMLEGGTVKLLSTGYELNFNNTIIILTSNVGAADMQAVIKNKRIGFSQDDEPVDQSKVESAAMKAVEKQFKPEFINRFDAIVPFNSLTDDQLQQVLDAHVERSNPRYRRIGNIALSLTTELKTHLIESAENRKEYGARPVVLQYNKVERKLARLATQGKIGGHMVHATFEENEIEFYKGEMFNEGMATIEEILALHPGGFEIDEPDCEDDEDFTDEFPEDLPEKVTPIRKRKK